MCVQGCVIVSELDDPSGHHDFPWMALHCNFQGLVAESNSDRNPGSGCSAKRAATSVCLAATERAQCSARVRQWTEPLAGTACGCANDRRRLHWRHVVARLEFCLRQPLPPFPAGFWKTCQQHIRNPGSSGPAEAPAYCLPVSGSTSAALVPVTSVMELPSTRDHAPPCPRLPGISPPHGLAFELSLNSFLKDSDLRPFFLPNWTIIWLRP